MAGIARSGMARSEGGSAGPPRAGADGQAEPQVLRVAQPPCQGLIYLSETVVLQCSQPAGHATMPGHPSLHSITVQWAEDVARLSPGGQGG